MANPIDHPPGGEDSTELRVRARVVRPIRRTAQRLFEPAAPRVWTFSLVLGLTGLAIAILGFGGITPLPLPIRIPWPVIALGFYLAEINVVEVHFRRETHAFTLSEVPTVIGLFLLSPVEYIAALLIGSGIALLFHLHQPPIRLVLNLAYYFLIGGISVVIFHGLGEFAGAPTPRDWAATFAATLTTCVLGALVIATAISLSGGAPQYQKLPEMLRFAGGVALANTSLALLAVTLLWREPLSLWLLGLPVLAIFIAYRAYVSEREKGQRLELLYESSRILQRTPELDSALVALLEHTREMFRAERAEIILYPSAQEATALRTACGIDQPTTTMVPVTISDVDPVHRRIAADGRAFRHQPHPEGAGGIRELMACPLAGEERLIGAMIITNRIAEGTSFGDDDLRLLETIGNQVATALENGQLEQSLAELSRLKEQLRHQAYHDPLTNLANRALFAEQVESTLERREGGVPVVLFLDLDDFKIVNDTQGHATGDRLLVAVAERIVACVRDNDVAARLGGDEFGILIIDRSGLDDAITVAGRLLETLTAPFIIQGRELLIGASIGIAAARPNGERAEELLRNADVAMYTAKATGKHRFAVFEPTMHAALVARHELSSELSRSVARGELEVFYQPIVDLRTSTVTGVEALTRWRHPTRGFVPPDEFIRLAEDSGAILALGRWVLHTAASQVVRWRDELGGRLTLSVNLSPSELQQAAFIGEVEAILTQTRLEPEDLVLEMTETAMFQDAQTTIHKLESLRRRGVRIAVDDFGTGYSSLGYLRRFPVDILKIARDFLATDPPSRPAEASAGRKGAPAKAPAAVSGGPDAGDATDPWAFAHAIVALGQTLGLSIVAEGIETSAQLERLRSLGCEFGQGYLFLKPVDAASFTRFLEDAWQTAALGSPAAAADGLPVPARNVGAGAIGAPWQPVRVGSRRSLR